MRMQLGMVVYFFHFYFCSPRDLSVGPIVALFPTVLIFSTVWVLFSFVHRNTVLDIDIDNTLGNSVLLRDR